MILAGVVVLALVALRSWFSYRKKQSHRLELRFGPNTADPSMNSEAEQRPNRNSGRAKNASSTSLSYIFHVFEAARFSETWKDLQGRFVDNPKGAVDPGRPVGS